jgi:biotin transport system substrate-specific component
MYPELALIPRFIIQRGNKIQENILSIILGVLSLSILAQIAIPIPWTPVPITGQTFGVSLIALMWGRKRATACIFSYLLLGGIGLPIFAMGKSGLLIGPTTGYLIGMAVATYWMGALSDRGWTRSWWKSYCTAFSGSLIIFSFGVLGLSLFIPSKDLLSAGVLPFLPGDLLKTLLSSFIAFRALQSLENKI